MNRKTFFADSAPALLSGALEPRAAGDAMADDAFSDTFAVVKADFASTGRSLYFIILIIYITYYDCKEKKKTALNVEARSLGLPHSSLEPS